MCMRISLKPGTDYCTLSDRVIEELHHYSHHQVFPGERRISMSYLNRINQGDSWKELAYKLNLEDK